MQDFSLASFLKQQPINPMWVWSMSKYFLYARRKWTNEEMKLIYSLEN